MIPLKTFWRSEIDLYSFNCINKDENVQKYAVRGGKERDIDRDRETEREKERDREKSADHDTKLSHKIGIEKGDIV